MSRILLFFLLFQATFSAPIDRAKQHDDAKGQQEKQSSPQQSCFFSKVQKASWETMPRPAKSIVSSLCSEKLIKLGELSKLPIDAKTGESNAVELLLCRGAGKCDLDLSKPDNMAKWKDVLICESHADELVRKWRDSHSIWRNKHIFHTSKGGTTHEACSMPDQIGRKHTTRPHEHLRILKIVEADIIGKETGYLVHPGIPICNSHDEHVRAMVAKKEANPPKKAKVEQSLSEAMVDDSCSSDPDFLIPKSASTSPAVSSLMQFAKCVGVHRICFPQKSFSELKERTKEKKACAVRTLMRVIFETVAPDDPDDFEKRVMGKIVDDESWTTGSSKSIDNILKQTAAQFFAAEVRTSKLIVLSLVANSVSHLQIEKYIPSLSMHMYNAARKFARRDRSTEIPAKKLERYNPLAVQSFVEFITSPTVMIGLPFGTRKVKLADGSKLEIPNSIRQQSSSEIYDMYSNFLEETNQVHLKLSKSTIFRILEACAATDRKATTCVDYFIANGMEALEGLHRVLDNWITEKLIDEDALKHLKTALFESAQYLRTDYRLHVKPVSRIADHCANYALSDPTDKKMSSSCSTGANEHKHNLKCDRCELVNETLKKFKDYAGNIINKAEEAVSSTKDRAILTKRKEELVMIENYIDKVFEMKQHLLRAAFTSQERSEIITALADNEALITLDFAQKYLPKWHREKQSSYFGKKGISYHISHVTARIGSELTQHSFVHIYSREVTQDSGLVIFTIAHVAAELKKVGINRISLRSDNAGAYHCASTINALHWLNQTTGVTFGTYTFSEAQNGKSSSDRDANRVKRKAENYVAKGSDITTSTQFFSALKEEKLLNGVSVHHGSVTIKNAGDAKWPGISNLNHFTLEPEGIRGRRYGSIGEGHFVPKSQLKSPTGSFKFEEAGFVAAKIESIKAERNALLGGIKTKFWYHYECAKNAPSDVSTCIREDDDVTPELGEFTNEQNSDVIGKLYACPEHGCSSTFLKHWNLEKHVLRGQHKISPEKLTARDSALKFFVRKLEDVERTRTCPVVGEALKELEETTENTQLSQGWALPKKQQRKPFEEDVKKFLIEQFDEGLKKNSKKRLDPITVADRMITEKRADGSLRFKVEERKDARQIAGFFSREAEKRRTSSLSRTKRDNVEAYKEEYVVPEDEHDDAGWIRFLKDEETWTTADEFYYSLMRKEDPIFTFGS